MSFNSFMKKMNSLTNKINKTASSVKSFNRALNNLATIGGKSKNTIKIPAPRNPKVNIKAPTKVPGEGDRTV